jgi:1,4-alpha-glucan branching enzyme
MKKFYLLVLCLMSISVFAQDGTSITPTISPALFRYNDQITVTYDVTGTPLQNLTSAYIWVWIPGKTLDAKYNVNPAPSNSSIDAAKFTKAVVEGRTTFTLTFKPSDFFTPSIAAETKIGMLIKANDWGNGKSVDYVTDLWDGSFQVKLTAPTQVPFFVDTDDDITITAETPINADYDLYIDDVLINEQNGIKVFNYVHNVTETSGGARVKIVATANATSKETSFQYIISGNSPTAVRPAGIISGINYKTGDPTKVTLCLLAPGKSSVYVVGDFSNWDVRVENIMKRDGEHFWIELSGLTPGQEYAFQYLVNESVFIADPYADKILDPDDQYIPPATYPNLKAFPEKARHDKWYFNRLSVFQTNQTPYNWQVTNFVRPKKEKMVIYELLVRDFFENGDRKYQNLIDTIAYFKRLGINAIELMPIMEFNGNESWGYNPAFMFAVDKYYGTKNKFKEFIDVCHQNGIAVILDIAMNHQDIPNSYVLMDFDFSTMRPTPENRWFNVQRTHPFNVFYDMDHDTPYTKHYLDTVNHYWLNEYKIDGFRFDLSKGFTSVNYCTTSECNTGAEVNAWSSYDASRVANLKRMADEIWSHTPDAIVILEHLAVNLEEKELAEYRAEEGKGMMLWGKMTDQYNQNTMGFEGNSNVDGIMHTMRGWSKPHLVGYMESHDEERLMYKNLQFGAAKAIYKVKDLSTSLTRMRAANVIFYTLPGPKMLWQFGELGYDYSINYCPEDGSISDQCRVSPKPVKWDYYEDNGRQLLYLHTAEIIGLRNTYRVFTEGTPTFVNNGLVKQITLKNSPYIANPATSNDMNVQIATNFDLSTKDVAVSFPHTGTWYNYASGSSIIVSSTPMTIPMDAGSYLLFTDVEIAPSIVTSTELGVGEKADVVLYPNPTGNILYVKNDGAAVKTLNIHSNTGASMSVKKLSDLTWDVSHLPAGLYIVELQRGSRIERKKIVKK